MNNEVNNYFLECCVLSVCTVSLSRYNRENTIKVYMYIYNVNDAKKVTPEFHTVLVIAKTKSVNKYF